MSDGNSIAGAIADTAKDFTASLVSEVVTSTNATVKSAGQQLSGSKTEEEEAKEKIDKVNTFNRIKQIEAEMEQIRQAKSGNTGPQITTNAQTTAPDDDQNGKPKTIDEASRQAVGRAEQGRNFKG